MNQNRGIHFWFIAFGLFLILGTIFYFTDFIQNEGFNPTDDGVILAQSYRILNGEIPHKDFISIRPAMSGVLHMLNFYLPFPLVESSRTFVLLQIFIFSLLWAFLLVKIFLKNTAHKKQLFFFACLGLLTFLLNLNTYHLYPWTTIDAVLFSTFGFAFLLKAIKNTPEDKAFFFNAVFALIFFSIAALCRQTFIFLPFATGLFLLIKYVNKSCFIKLTFTFILGSSPFLIYHTYLVSHNAIPEFVAQMTGRTELFETGILRYIKSCIIARLGILNLIILFFVFISMIKWIPKSNQNLIRKFTNYFRKENKTSWSIIIGIYSFALIFGIFWFFFHKDYKIIPFEFFWILFTLTVVGIQFKIFNFREIVLLGFSIIIAWTSSISLGANSPIFVFGFLASVNLIIIYKLIDALKLIDISKLPIIKFQIFSAILTIALVFVSIHGQRKFNYRQLESDKLEFHLGDLIPAFGNIKTDQNTYGYYKDFMHLYHQYELKDHFIIIPNNAILYPALDSKNPLPLDWLIKNEHIGADEQLLESFQSLLQNDNTYILVDKINSIEMGMMPFEDMVYPPEKFIYMELIKKYYEVESESIFFKIYKLK
jgi:hypothetical protein